MTTSAKRFELLYAPHQDLLRGYVHRLIGNPGDADDVIQDVLIKALEKLPTLRSDAAFRGWLMKIATSTSLDHLRKAKRWRPFSQSYVEQECAENDELRGEVIATTKDAEFEFDVREHISFCFTCVARSLSPEEEAAVVLREVLSLSNREAADALGVTESVLRHRLSDGRRSMEKSFDGLCALVNKEGMCHQCEGFRGATAAERRGPRLPVLNNQDDLWGARLEQVRERQFEGGVSASLHNLLFENIKRLEDVAGS
jgi:RNA polymerase sigma-70 factor (ECF subfamily)